MEFYTNVEVHRGYILYSGYKFGNRVREKIKYRPYLFLPNSSNKKTQYADLDGRSYDRMNFNSIYELNEFVKKYEGVDNYQVCGTKKYAHQFIYDKFDNLKYNLDLVRVVSIDIEVAADEGFPSVDAAEKEVTAISVRKGKRIVVLGCGEYQPHRDDIIYIKCKDEEELLFKFIEVWKKFDPDIVTGWNTDFFDIPYLINRIRRLLGDNKVNELSPWGVVEERTKFLPSGEKLTLYRIYGVTSVDYLQAYKKFSFKNQESYKLDYIAQVVLGEKKIDYSEHGDLLSLYKNDYQKFIVYNVHDTDLVLRIDEKEGYISQIMSIAYMAKVNYEDAFTSVKLWEVIIHNHLRDNGIVSPIESGSKQRKDHSIVGGYVKNPQVGMHEYVASFDLDSLYPHLIMQYNISPETLVAYKPELRTKYDIEDIINGALKNDDFVQKCFERGLTYTPNGCLFRKDRRGFLPYLMDKLYSDRTVFKKAKIEFQKKDQEKPSEENKREIAHAHNMQLAIKIILNSAYGALSNIYFQWFSIELAEAVTTSGQLSIRWVEDRLNRKMNEILKTNGKDYVIASDTDSIIVSLDRVVRSSDVDRTSIATVIEFMDEVCDNELKTIISEAYDELADYIHAYEQKMFMKREALADRAVWTAKKKYIMNMYDFEGVRYREPVMKIMGIESVRSSTPLVCRDNIKAALKHIMNNDEKGLRTFIDTFREEFFRCSFDQIAAPSSVNDVDKYYDASSIYRKGTPIHVRGSLLYNHYVRKHDLRNKYKLIHSGDKIKYCYMKVPNPIHENVIAILDVLPSEFGLEKYIDYDLQFDKKFVEPIRMITNKIGWSVEEVSTIDSFFS